MRRINIFLILVVLLCLMAGVEGKGGRGGGSRGGSRRSSTTYVSGGGGGGGGMDGTTIVIILVVVFVVVVGGVSCYYCLKEGDSESSTEPERRVVEPAYSVATRTYTVSDRVRRNRQIVYSTETLKNCEVPYNVIPLEERDMYREQGVWRKYMPDVSDHQIRKRQKMFKAMDTEPFGSRHSCNACYKMISEGVRWYRCRSCLDVDLCQSCFEKGPTITDPSSTHTVSHECARLLKHIRCSECKCFIIDTKYRCENCYNTYFCFGCHEDMDTSNLHSSHELRKFNATSFVMKPVNELTSTEGNWNPPTYPAGESYPMAPYPTGAAGPYPTEGVPPYPTGGAPPYPAAGAPPYPVSPSAPGINLPDAPPPSYDEVTA